VVLPPPIRPGTSPAEAEAARRTQTRDRHAALDFTDDLFEALYREGVDLSWP
jgi:hypothetical protein